MEPIDSVSKESTTWEKILLWAKITRPQSLFAAIAPVLVGLMMAGLFLKGETMRQATEETLREAQLQKAIAEKNDTLLQGLNVYITDDTVELLHTDDAVPSFSWWVAIVTLLCAISLQIFANLVNDYYDFRNGADKKGRIGFDRYLAEGVVTPQQIKRAMMIALGLSIFWGLVLIRHGGWPILLIGLACIFFAWKYTASRHPLSYIGVADIIVFIFFGVIATEGTFLLQTDQWSWHCFVAGGVNGVISMCVLCINNLRDIDDDASVGKKTIPVRFGKKAGHIELFLCAVASLAFAWIAFGFSWPCLIILPMAYLFYEVLHAESKEYNKCLVHAGMCNMIYVALVFIMMLIRMS